MYKVFTAVLVLSSICAPKGFAGQSPEYGFLSAIERGSTAFHALSGQNQDCTQPGVVHPVLFGWGSKKVTPESVVDKFMQAKSLLEGGKEDLSIYFTPEFVAREGNRFHETALRLKFSYTDLKRLAKLFKQEEPKLSAVRAESSDVVEQEYFVSAPGSHFKYGFNVRCKTDSSQKIESCLIADVQNLR